MENPSDFANIFAISVRVADGLTALAYFTIPMQLIYWGYRKQMGNNLIGWLFVAFIFFCGCTHLLQVFFTQVVNLWILGIFKWITSVVSILCAIGMIGEVPRVLSLESQVVSLKDQIINFTDYIFHEIRVPLNSIVIGNENLLNSGKLEGDELKTVEISKKSLEKIIHILNDILDIRKIEKDKLKVHFDWYSLSEIINDILDEFRSYANFKNLELIKCISRELSAQEIYLDRMRITQCINNLISNAIKYTSEGYIKITGEIDEQQRVHIVVEDTGCGISQENQEKLFKPYVQIYNQKSSEEIGTGLGLVITKEIVNLHQGSITFSSELDVGSKFEIILDTKMRKISGSRIQKEKRPDDLIKYKPEFVLVVDDNRDNCYVMTQMLHNLGIESTSVNNGQEAIKYYKQYGTQVDLILMDRMMPILDGIEATKKIRNIYSSVVIFGLTGLADDRNLQEFIQAGANEVISKPLQITTLIELMNRYFAPTMPDPANVDLTKEIAININ